MALDAASSQAPVRSHFLSHSSCKITKLCHTWTIEHLSYHCDPNLHLPDYLQSSNFSPHKFNPERAQFRVRLYPRGDEQSGNDATQNGMSLYLHLESDQRDSLTVSLKVATLSASGEKANLKEATHNLSPGSKCGWQDYVAQDDLLKDIKDDTCTLSIEVMIHSGMSHMPVTKDLELLSDVKGSSSNYVVDQTVKSFTLTSWQMESLSYDWSIANFSQTGANGQEQRPIIRSPIIVFPNSKYIFRIIFYPKGDDMDGYISLFLDLYPQLDEQENVNILFQISLLKSGRGLFSKIGKRAFSKKFPTWGMKQFISQNELLDPTNGFVLDDKLTINLEVTILFGTNTMSSSDMEEREQIKLLQLAAEQTALDLGNLLKNRILCDVAFIVGEQKFAAHKSVLSARSDVFGSMFKHDLEENKQNRVLIVDMEPAVVEKFLQFVYSGKVDNLEDYADKLLMAAEKYQMATLKSLCEHCLVAKLTSETMLSYLILADMYNARKLKESAIECIILESATVMHSEGFKEFFKSYPDLSHEVFCAMTKKLNV